MCLSRDIRVLTIRNVLNQAGSVISGRAKSRAYDSREVLVHGFGRRLRRRRQGGFDERKEPRVGQDFERPFLRSEDAGEFQAFVVDEPGKAEGERLQEPAVEHGPGHLADGSRA